MQCSGVSPQCDGTFFGAGRKRYGDDAQNREGTPRTLLQSNSHLLNAAPGSLAMGPEWRQIDTRIAVCNKIGDQATGKRAERQPVMLMPEGEKDVRIYGGCTDDRPRVGECRPEPKPVAQFASIKAGKHALGVGKQAAYPFEVCWRVEAGEFNTVREP